MRNVFCLSVLISVLALPGGAVAQQATAENEQAAGGNEQAVAIPGIPEESCFGDSYESDRDVNEGNRITEEEILLLINPPRA